MEVALAVLDTNTFLQYQHIEQIPWPRLLGTDRVELLIAPVVARELDRLKDYGNKRQKDRARTALKLFKSALGDSDRDISPGVAVRFLTREPTIDCAQGLSRDQNDDRLIASLLSLPEYGSERVVLVTRDIGPSIKALAIGIETLEIPEKYELPDEPDPDVLRIRELERQVREMRSVIPDLRLAYTDGSNVMHVSIRRVPERPSGWIETALTEQRAKYRRSPLPRNPEYPQGSIGDILRQTQLLEAAMVPPSELERYERDLEAYLVEYRDYLMALASFESRKCLTFSAAFELRNEGTAVADDINVNLHIPDGLHVFESDQESRQPAPPDPPVPPQTQASLVVAQLMGPPVNLSGFMPPTFPSLRGLGPTPNVSDPSIRRTNSYDVGYAVKRIKHGYTVKLGPLYCIFESAAAANSFHIGYRIDAANVPKPVVGQLHVVVQTL